MTEITFSIVLESTVLKMLLHLMCGKSKRRIPAPLQALLGVPDLKQYFKLLIRETYRKIRGMDCNGLQWIAMDWIESD